MENKLKVIYNLISTKQLMTVGKFISITILLILALLLYRAEEHFEHLLAVMKDELDH